MSLHPEVRRASAMPLVPALLLSAFVLMPPAVGAKSTAHAKHPKSARVAPARTQPARQPLLAAGTSAPDFTVQNKAGNPVKLSDYKGKVVVLDFWATWCGPCQMSLPHTNEVAKQFADKGVVVLAVCVSDTQTAFDGWLPKHPEYDSITFAIDPSKRGDPRATGRLYHVSGIPTQYVIGKDGKVVISFVGYGGPTTDLADAITKAMAAPTAQSASAR